MLIAASAAMGGLTGCSLTASSTLSAASVEAKISAQLAGTYDIPPPKVKCPASIPAKVGSRFTCTTTLYGQPLEIAGTVVDSRGHIHVRPKSPIVVTSTAESEIAKSLSATFGHTVTASCRLPPLLVAEPGHTFGCTAAIAGIERQVVVTVTKVPGVLRYRVLPYKPTAAKRR